MRERDAPARGWIYKFRLWFIWLAACGVLPARWFQSSPPPKEERAARTGQIRVEIVSHCWGYSNLLAYQLSALVNHPPTRMSVTMTVFHAAEDRDTVAMLCHFESMQIPNVTWNWQVLDRARLFRRAIGRNQAALVTQCDWVWFTDCDVVFGQGCLDGLADALQGRRDALVFPRMESCSAMLEPDDSVLRAAAGSPQLVDIDPSAFIRREREKATGPLQITHGDVARACGYCRDIRVYQEPVERWAKAQEDRAFRWLLGTPGTPVDVPGVYRIRHRSKGRYGRKAVYSRIRTAVRRLQLRMREGRHGTAKSGRKT